MSRKGILSIYGLFSFLFLLIGITVLPSVIGGTESISYLQSQNQDVNTSRGNDWWSMFRHDVAHSGFSTALVPEDNQLLWSYQTEQVISSSPVVSHGRVYIGSWDWNIYCFAMDSGALLWNYSTTGEITSSPAVVNGKLYVGSQDTKLYCLSAMNGSYLWSFKTSFIIESCPTVVDDKVIFGSSDGSLYCLDANDGSLLWEYETNSVFISSPAVVNGKVYVGDTSGGFFCLDSDTGGMVWVRTMTEGSYSTPCFYEGKIYFGCNDENMYCLNADDGSILWNYSTFSDVYSSPAVAYNSVYVGTSDGRLLCLNKDTGGFLWSYQISGSVTSSPAVADGKVYFDTDPCCGFTSYLVCLNAYTGTKIWDSNLNTQIQTKSSPALAAGKVFVGSGGGTVFAFGDIVFMADANGPYLGTINTSIDFTGSVYGGHPNFSWLWDFGDGATSTEQNTSHTYASVGEYVVSLTVTDSQGHVAMDDTQSIIGVPNLPPEAPMIDGPTTGNPDISYEYSFLSSDVNDDTLYYYIDWGDNTTSGWVGPFPSGDSMTQEHLWSSPGSYMIKAKAKDRHGAESNWSVSFVMTIATTGLDVDIRGGFGATVTIRNAGDAVATNVSWNVTLEKGFIIYPKNFHNIPTVAPGGNITEKILVFGFGKTIISASVRCDEGISLKRTVQATILVFFVFGIP